MTPRAKLYALEVSHPSHAVRLMLEHKGIPYETTNLEPGLHPLQLRLAGFRGGTVPALRIDGRRVQQSLRISRALEELQPDPPLFPGRTHRRAAIEDAEVWGERELQGLPRRFYRWGLVHDAGMRRRLASFSGMPAPGLQARINRPLARRFAAMIGADDAGVRHDLAELPGKLDRVDALIAEGVLGRPRPNAADYQIGMTVRVLLAFDDLRPKIEGRPAAGLAMRLMPSWPEQIPPVLPREWI